MDDQENSNINGNKLWKTIEESRETDFVNSTLNSSSAANDDREIHSTLTGATLPNSIDNPQHNISTPVDSPRSSVESQPSPSTTSHNKTSTSIVTTSETSTTAQSHNRNVRNDSSASRYSKVLL